MRPCLDDLRAARPELGFALYAFDPGGEVTLEVLHEGKVYTFKGPTEADAILEAFPIKAPPEPETQDSVFD